MYFCVLHKVTNIFSRLNLDCGRCRAADKRPPHQKRPTFSSAYSDLVIGCSVYALGMNELSDSPILSPAACGVCGALSCARRARFQFSFIRIYNIDCNSASQRLLQPVFEFCACSLTFVISSNSASQWVAFPHQR